MLSCKLDDKFLFFCIFTMSDSLKFKGIIDLTSVYCNIVLASFTGIIFKDFKKKIDHVVSSETREPKCTQARGTALQSDVYERANGQ